MDNNIIYLGTNSQFFTLFRVAKLKKSRIQVILICWKKFIFLRFKPRGMKLWGAKEFFYNCRDQ